MIRSKIAISSKDYYSCELTKKLPVRVTILAINGGEGLGFYESLDNKIEDLEKYVQFMQKSPQVEYIKVTHKSEKRFWTRVVHKLDYPSIHDTILESGSMTILPMIIENGVQYHTILSPTPKAFRDLIKKLQDRFSTIQLRATSSKPTETTQYLLTGKQYEAIKLAFKKGYYEIPRKCTLEELSTSLGIKRVAMQERIRRAESRIMKEYAGSNLFF
ncbi:MAG: helix-turn-helix domain-containing protein [Candidatus Heimdallarchaeaceae archaeon]